MDYLEEHIIEFKKRHNNRPIQVLAHSMGGVLVMAVVNRNPELFHSIVFVGVPFGSGIGYLRDLHLGQGLGLNSKAFNKDVLFSFPSSFWTFPHDGEKIDHYCGLFEYDEKRIWAKGSHVTDHASLGVAAKIFNRTPPAPDEIPSTEKWGFERTKIDFYNADDWIKYELGIFNHKNGKFVTEREKNHLQSSLNRGKLFRRMIQYDVSVNYPPITVVSGNKYPTQIAIIRNGPQAHKGGLDFESAPKVIGDGRIPYMCSFPDSRIVYKTVDSDLHHQELLSDISLYSELLSELL